MAYGYGRRRTRRTYRSRARASTRYSRSRSRAPRSGYRRPIRRSRRAYARARGGQRTIRLVIQTVAASPLTLGMKGNQPVRRMF